ncbi:nuclease [Loktanella sp. 5RATIMAR09]|nr:nuclease [Loktanella sp. 5RATIMAR09]
MCSSQASSEGDEQTRYVSYTAKVVRVIDGDTLDVEVDLWPGLIAQYAVRVRGIDAPELRRVGCEEERIWGQEARNQVEKLYPEGTVVRLEYVARDAFDGRVVADVKRWRSDRWLSLADELIQRGLAVEWEPTMADVQWCLLATTREGVD